MVNLDTRKGDWIQTYSAIQFWPIDPRAEEVDIRDIAHSLSLMCRYAGHCNKFYSVAEHSVLVSRSLPPKYQLWGLLHDATEAYLVDIPRPIKPSLTNYYSLEAQLMEVICDRYGLTKDMPPEVKWADNSILNDERDQNMSSMPSVSNRNWGAGENYLGVELQLWSPEVAEQKFLWQYSVLTGDTDF